MTTDQIEREHEAARERRERARVERDLLILEVQKDIDMSPADKDHFRDALNATYAAANGSIDRIADMAASNVLWARIHVRGFATDARVKKSLEEIKALLRDHLVSSEDEKKQREFEKNQRAIETRQRIDVSKMSWSGIAKNAAYTSPVWIALSITSIVIALIVYGFGDRILKACFGI